MTAIIVDCVGVRPAAMPADIRDQVGAGRFFWLDIFGGDELLRVGHLGQLELDDADMAWAVRFGQAGRMNIGRHRLRCVTWMADPGGNLIEVHLLCSPRCVLTMWTGEAAALDDIRQQFAERAGGRGTSFYLAAGILLQLLLGTLDHAIRELDLGLENLRIRLDKNSSSDDFAVLARRLQRLQSVVAGFNRYSSAVRSAIVGIEAVPGMDARGAAELNDYAEQVEDVEEQLYERRRWMSDMMHDYSTAIAQRQGEQINRLTLVSLIFLPVTALTGFFGMNFNWMMKSLASRDAFLLLGVMLPAASVALSIAWFKHRGLIQLRLWPFGARARPSTTIAGRGLPARSRPDDAGYSAFGVPEAPPEPPGS